MAKPTPQGVFEEKGHIQYKKTLVPLSQCIPGKETSLWVILSALLSASLLDVVGVLLNFPPCVG